MTGNSPSDHQVDPELLERLEPLVRLYGTDAIEEALIQISKEILSE